MARPARQDKYGCGCHRELHRGLEIVWFDNQQAGQGHNKSEAGHDPDEAGHEMRDAFR